MRARNRLATLACLLASGPAAANVIDYPIACTGSSIDADLTSAISEAAAMPVHVLLSGTCVVASYHAINGAITIEFIGTGAASTSIVFADTGTYAFFIGQTTGGANVAFRTLTLQGALHGAIGALNSTLTVDGVRFVDNAGAFGGAIGATAANITISRTSFENSSASAGGAIAAEGVGVALSITDSTFSGGTSSGSAGAIFANTVTTIDRVLFSGNSATSSSGGAIYAGADLAIRNSTFAGNSANSGGAIAFGASLTMNNVTMHGDSATTGGSELQEVSAPPTLNIFNTLIGGTCGGFVSAPAAHGSIESPGNTCGLSGAGNQVSVPDASLALGALANNGGATQTLYPNPGSVLIDAASTDCEGVDQRDLVRDIGACDVGAVEAGASLSDEIFPDGFDG